jgi:integrase
MFKEGKNENDTFEKYRSGLSDNRKHIIIIPTEEEFETLATTTISDKRLDFARDLFLLGCTTGLRYSDVIRLGGNNIKTINGENYIETNIQKTGDYLRIPLNSLAEDVLKKNAYILRSLTNQKLNKALHDLFEHLGFNSIETITERYGSRTIAIRKPKYEIMTMHDSRRYFLSVCMNTAGVSAANVMEWSGHKNLKTLQRYIKQGMNQEDQMRKVFDARKFKLIKINSK